MYFFLKKMTRKIDHSSAAIFLTDQIMQNFVLLSLNIVFMAKQKGEI